MTTSKYQSIDPPGVTTADDPNRGMWYSAFPDRCGFWTDEWDLLGATPEGIPACPHCSAVGKQMPFEHWDDNVRAFEDVQGNPHYHAFVQSRKNRCFREDELTGGWGLEYARFAKAQL